MRTWFKQRKSVPEIIAVPSLRNQTKAGLSGSTGGCQIPPCPVQHWKEVAQRLDKVEGRDARGSRLSRIERHMTVDTRSLPYAIAFTTAEVTDRQEA